MTSVERAPSFPGVWMPNVVWSEEIETKKTRKKLNGTKWAVLWSGSSFPHANGFANAILQRNGVTFWFALAPISRILSFWESVCFESREGRLFRLEWN
jgi:hypothetical protein